MRILREIQNHPVSLLCVIVFGLIVWFAANLVGPRDHRPVAALVPPEVPPGGPRSFPGPPAMAATDLDTPDPARRPPVSAALLPRLKPGMTRSEVECILGQPAPEQVHPVVAVEGRLTYRTAYELADPDVPATVRPILKRRVPPGPKAPPPVLVTLEFDATQPGHPLIEVRYAEQTF